MAFNSFNQVFFETISDSDNISTQDIEEIPILPKQKSIIQMEDKRKGKKVIRRQRVGEEFDVIIPRRPFEKIVRELLQKSDKRITKDALYALQVAAEDYLIQYFANSNLASKHAKRETLQLEDVNLIKAIKKDQMQL